MTLKVLDRTMCLTKEYLWWNSHQLTSGMICTKNKGVESTCKGDSGGPLILPKSSTDDTAVVVGITSFGPGGCSGLGPTVFTEVKNYLNWIKPKMEK